MSIDSSLSAKTTTATTSAQLEPTKARASLYVNTKKLIPPALSNIPHPSIEKGSIKSSTIVHQHDHQPVLRSRAKSSLDQIEPETPTKLSTQSFFSNDSHDKQTHQTQIATEKSSRSQLEHRNSVAQSHFTTKHPMSLFGFKHSSKSNTIDETPTHQKTSQENKTFISTAAIQFKEAQSMQTDPSGTSKTVTTPTDCLKSTQSPSMESQPSHNRDESATSSSATVPFVFDENKLEPRSASSLIYEFKGSLCVSDLYQKSFLNLYHVNYCGKFDDGSPFIVSLRCIYDKTLTVDSCQAHAIIRTQNGNYSESILVNKTNEHDILGALWNQAKLQPIIKVESVTNPKANDKIYLFDKTNDERQNFKIGVLYQLAKQTNECEIFNNQQKSKELEDFLKHISECVVLKSFAQYRGDLDTKNDLHGKYSYYVQYKGREIMFNVAPLITAINHDELYTTRKGLVGNSFVCIVFQEPGAEFSPDFISSKVTQIYITVKPMDIHGKLHYKIGIWRRQNIISLIDPPGGVIIYDNTFQDYFLTLLLNAIDTAIKSPVLNTRIHEQRQRLKSEELNKLYDTLMCPIVELNSEMNTYHNPYDSRLYSSRSYSASHTNLELSTSNHESIPITPVKKKGFQKKLFSVFSGRSGSTSSSSIVSSYYDADELPTSSQGSSISDLVSTNGRTAVQHNKETADYQRPSKGTSTTARSPRPSNKDKFAFLGISSKTVLTASNIDSSTDSNIINTDALGLTPRSRSNSSPEDTVNVNKPQATQVLTTVKSNEKTNSTDSNSDDEQPSENENL